MQMPHVTFLAPRTFEVAPSFLKKNVSPPPGFKFGYDDKYLLGCDLVTISNLKMETALPSETLVPMYFVSLYIWLYAVYASI